MLDLDLVIECPCCYKAQVIVGGVCPKCGVGIPGERLTALVPKMQRGRPKKPKGPVFNTIRLPKEWV